MMRVLDSLTYKIAELLHTDSLRILLGEDVTDGGMLGLSRACLENPELKKRLIATPLVPTASIAHAASLATSGFKPILLLPSIASLLEGYSALYEATRWVQQTQLPTSLIVLAPCGSGFGLGGFHDDAPTAALCCIPGLRVVCLGQAKQATALLEEVANFTDTKITVILLPRKLLLQDVDQMKALSSSVKNAEVLYHGSRASVFAWGAAVEQAERALLSTQREHDDHEISLVDIRSLVPLDTPTLIKVAQETGKLVIVHEGIGSSGTGAELAALFAEHAIFQLDAPILRVTCMDPNEKLCQEDSFLPSIEQIVQAIHKVVNF